MKKELKKFGVTFHQRTLKNGVNLFHFERKGMPIYLEAVFFAGSRFDEITGTAHFLEHMLLAGTQKFPTKNIIADYIQRVGGDFGASTDNNVLRLYVEVPEAQDIDVGINVLSECLTKSIFDEKTIENEKKVIISELRGKMSNPREYLNEIRRKIALQGTTASRSTLGGESDINSITKETIVDYFIKFITSGRVCFVSSGDIEIENLENKLNLVNLPKDKRFTVEGKLPIYKKTTEGIEFYDKSDQVHASLVTRTSIENYKEYCALMLLVNVLGLGRGSRLTTKIRYEKGLVYSIFANVFSTVDWGTLSITFSCHRDNFEKVRDLIFQEFMILKNNISDSELKNTISKISKGAVSDFQTSKSWVNFHETEALFTPLELHTVENYIETIGSIDLKDIKFVIDKYFIPTNFLTAICGNYQK